MASLGDLLFRDSALWKRLVGNTTTTRKFLRQVGNGSASAAPAWDQVTDADLSTSDITTNNVATTKHGFAPKLPNDATKYLDGTGAYTVPSGSGGAPTGASYVTLATDGTLTSERVLTAGSGISIADAGAGSTVTIAANGGGGVTGQLVVVKSADTSRNSTTTPTDDPHLAFGVGANEVWWWEAFIRYVCTSTTPDLKVGISVPGDATAEWGCVVDDLGPGRFAGWSNLGVPGGALLSKTGTQSLSTSGSANASGLYIAGWVFTNSNTGSFALQWAQNTSNATNVTFKQYSLLRYQQIA